MVTMPVEPTIGQILYHAISNKVDVATLERLVALKERVDAEKAGRELNAALLRFRAECPQILKTRPVKSRAGDTMYVFANLEDVKRAIDPVLHRHELSYAWDCDYSGPLTVTTCTVRHAGGGHRSAKFASKSSGALNMNDAQAAGSTYSYGQRYSLLAVLGISADLDDDGRSANRSPAPEHDATQPVTPTREERQTSQSSSAPPEPPVTAVELKALIAQWKAWVKVSEPTTQDERNELAGAFAYFCDKALGYVEPSGLNWRNVATWTRQRMQKCVEAAK